MKEATASSIKEYQAVLWPDLTGVTTKVNINRVLTSNRLAGRSIHDKDDALLCALDRIFNDATSKNRIKCENSRETRLEAVVL